VASVPPGGVANSASTIAVTAIVLAVSLAGVAAPAEAVTDVVGVAGAPAPISYFTGGHDPAPPPPPPPGCEPDSPDPACHPPPPPPHHHHVVVPFVPP
jgi:hypothetical protein